MEIQWFNASLVGNGMEQLLNVQVTALHLLDTSKFEFLPLVLLKGVSRKVEWF